MIKQTKHLDKIRPNNRPPDHIFIHVLCELDKFIGQIPIIEIESVILITV